MQNTDKQITLLVKGKKMTFSEEKLAVILTEYFDNGRTKQKSSKPICRPKKGVPFEVNPLEIDRNIFLEERKDEWQEKTRKHILDAFTEVDAHPEDYGKTFWTLRPYGNCWKHSRDHFYTIDDHKAIARSRGGHLANLIEQALEWAQRLQNGESWEALCNKIETDDWFKLIEVKKGFYRTVGGSCKLGYCLPASSLSDNVYDDRVYNRPDYTMPLVVRYHR